MNAIEISINGEAYPCRMTMGAMLRFKETTGHEVSEYDGSTLDMCALIWALVVSASKRTGKAFNMTFWDFCDNVDSEEMSRCYQEIQKQQGESTDADDGGEKKTP